MDRRLDLQMDAMYEAPTITTIGTLHELTMHPRGKDKERGPDAYGLMPDHIMGGSLGGGRPGKGKGNKWHKKGNGGGRSRGRRW